MSKSVINASEIKEGESPPMSLFPPAGKPVSVMRNFLESEVDFKWPDDVGKCSGNHCVLPDGARIPLVWKRTILDTKVGSIKVYTGRPDFVFQEAFVVKTIRDSNYFSSRTKAAKEVENMKDLRHPHVAALLGTFLHSSRLNILIYPAARCDLYHFLKIVSKELKDSNKEKVHHFPIFGSHSDGSGSPASSSSARSEIDRYSPVVKSREEPTGRNHDEVDPLGLSLTEKIDSLRQYFVCLSQALSYIHESDVRHKDVKPENVLIDSSGSVILTDFGISRRFPKSTPHETNDKWDFTRKYASPEIMKGKKVPRDDPSDVFSLGCVFLEMATLILQKNLDSFRTYYSSHGIDAYYHNLEKIYRWIEMLQESKRPVDSSILDASLIGQNVASHDFTFDRDQEMVASLSTIHRMLNETPLKRPPSKGLWKYFQSVSPLICYDCDEREDNRWRPSMKQQQNTESGVSARRSQHIRGIPEHATNEFPQFSPERISAEHKLLRQMASLPAVHRQIPSMPIHQSDLLSPYTANNSQQNSLPPGSPPGPFSSRSNRSSSNPLGKPRISRSKSPDTRERHKETQSKEIVSSLSRTTSNTSQLVQNPIDPQSITIPGSPSKASASPSNTIQLLMKPGSSKTNESKRQARTPSEEKLNPSTPILVYDKGDTLVYPAVFNVLKGRAQPPP
jgi:serine/threonine protein kinase